MLVSSTFAFSATVQLNVSFNVLNQQGYDVSYLVIECVAMYIK